MKRSTGLGGAGFKVGDDRVGQALARHVQIVIAAELAFGRVVGDLSLAYEVMELSAYTGLTLTAYSPEPNSPSEDGLALLASWAATQDQTSQSEFV